ncbi:hypothetical protein [Umezawaea beigongshangensis]|uniref:hypothetical protein n=1 Tax=Umezawaea beigongshangensis TaxID=2780383 RepID=UPI0018F1DA1B|nr:hypothetical protein [Umezawaea beigongshangensis]
MLIPFRLLAGTAVAALAALHAPAAALAHPFGPPSTARITVDGSVLSLTWLAAEDDWVALGQSLGAFEDPAAERVSTELTGEQKLRRSAAVHDYLLERIAVAQRELPCPGELAPLDGLLSAGARFTFECPAPVVDVDVTLSALTDLNESYRTVLTPDTPATPAQALFTGEQSTARLTFSGTSGGLPAQFVPLAVGTGAAALLGAAVLLVRRARRTAVTS